MVSHARPERIMYRHMSANKIITTKKICWSNMKQKVLMCRHMEFIVSLSHSQSHLNIFILNRLPLPLLFIQTSINALSYPLIFLPINQRDHML